MVLVRKEPVMSQILVEQNKATHTHSRDSIVPGRGERKIDNGVMRKEQVMTESKRQKCSSEFEVVNFD